MTSGGGKPPPRDVLDDPLMKPASEAGWDEPPASKKVAPEVDPAAPRRPTARVVDVKPAPPPVARPVEAARPSPPPVARPVEAARPAAEPFDAKVAPPVGAKAAAPVDAKTAPVAATSAAPAAAPAAATEPATEAKPEPLAAEATAKAASKVADVDSELRAAVGATPLVPAPHKRRAATEHDHDHDDDGELIVEGRAPRSLRSIFITAVGIAGVLAIGAFVVLGRSNSDRYVLTCEAERAVPQQGRAFPPWGVHALAGDAWRPLKIAAETRCQPRETDDPLVLERWFLAMLLDEVTAQLTAHDPARLDDTDALLKQSLLLTRPPAVAEAETLATERAQQHKDIERMLGDVTYWRAAAKLREAAGALADAAKQFDAAAAQRPRHVTDATAWGAYARKLSDQLRLGPAGGATPSFGGIGGASGAATTPSASDAPLDPPTPPRPSAPQGTALPVEPDPPRADKPDAKPDAKPDEAATRPEAPPATAPAAPTGGVLL